MTEVETDPDPDIVIVYVPAGVPFGLVFPPPPPPPPLPPFPLEPHPAPQSSSKRANVPSGTRAKTRRLRFAQRVRREIPRILRMIVPGSISRCRFVNEGGTFALREVVVMVNGEVEPAATFAALHAAPVGNPEHVRE